MLAVLLLSILPASDSLHLDQLHDLEEVVVVTGSQGGKRSVKGEVATIDEHLSQLNHVELVRRGSYAWEPTVNNMQTERLSTTIDGMKIFYACTDKMDPVTSYVESSNLQSISLNSGLEGNPQSTGNIGGSLDLKLRKAGFDNDPWSAQASVGHETNGRVQVYGADAARSAQHYYVNGGFFYRHADCYKTGGRERLLYSQFQKVNAFANLGLRWSDQNQVEATYIFDRATDVGYPALNMDVAKAEANIISLAYKHLWQESWLYSWETKVYYNHITHIMDDTTRPDVEIHMDMPGESSTSGLYSLLLAHVGNHGLTLNLDGYYNRLFADMTMYPGGAAPMYMVTWPDVRTLNLGASVADQWTLPHHQSLHLTAKWAWQQQHIHNQEGYNAQSVFFPGMHRDYTQIIGRAAANYQVTLRDWQLSLGAGWGSRAPSVTEAYGYYLNNTFDQYDYMGNPRLHNESATELNASLRWTPREQFSLHLDGNAFLFRNYIIGAFEPRLSAMTVGAEGVKVYGNLDHATIVNTSLSAKWLLLQDWTLDASLHYSHGRDDEGDNLPLIAPVTYQTRLSYDHRALHLQTEWRGHDRQSHFGAKYGETETSAWSILNLSGEYTFHLASSASLHLRLGVENLLDRRYSTYSDWCDIPQKGRNFYTNLVLRY